MYKEARETVQTLINHGYKAYFVGGYVRDYLLKRPIKDIDIATSALPSDVIRVFPHTAPTGLQHGTITVIQEEYTFEVTTFRKDTEYEDYRHPKQVDFINNLHEDLQRRDFTINAMAMDIDGILIDPFGGQVDLVDQKLLKCVGNAQERFQEDALRMMRCVRFAAEYDLEIEANTWMALIDHKENLRHVAMERIRVELEKIIEGRSPQKGLTLLVKSGLSDEYKVDIGYPISLWKEFAFDGAELLEKILNKSSRWSLMFLLTDVNSMAAIKILKNLTSSGKKIRNIVDIIRFHEWFMGNIAEVQFVEEHETEVEERWKTGAIYYGKETSLNWLNLIREISRYKPKTLLLNVSAELTEWLDHKAESWLDELQIIELKDLNISGNDLLQFDKKPGPWISKVLNQLLLDAAILKVENQYEPLLSHAKQVMKELENNDE